MNRGDATAFLPNFVRFPSLRGLHSSTVQPWRTPGAGPDAAGARRKSSPTGARTGASGCGSPCSRTLGRPVSAASPASAPAAARRAPAAGRTPAARGGATAGRGTAAGVAPVVPAVVPVAPRRTGVTATDPPAARTRVTRVGRRGRPAVRPVPPAGLAERHPGPPVPAGLGRRDEHDHGHRQDDAFDRGVTHGVTLLPFPRSGPPWAPRLAPRLARCRGDARPPRRAKQS